jgi:hypothetical protein
MKKLVISLLALLLCLPYFAACSSDNSAPSDLMFTISDDGTYAEVTTCNGQAKEVVIPDTYEGVPVTSIGEKAFYSCSFLTSVTIPDSVTSIGNNAFEDCEELLELILPGSVRRVGREAFAACRKLARVVIPENIEELEYDSFAFYTHNPDYMLLPKRYEPIDEEDVSTLAFGYEYLYIDNLIHFYGEVPDWEYIYNA